MATDQQSRQYPHRVPPTKPAAPPVTSHRATLDAIRELLGAGHVEKALNLAHKYESDSEVKNAVGVCHMRLCHPDRAVATYRGMTLGPGGVYLKPDVPDKYKTNFATALLLTGNVTGCTSILRDLQDDNYPAAHRLLTAIDAWKKTLSFWQWFNLALGVDPNRPVKLDFPPGEV